MSDIIQQNDCYICFDPIPINKLYITKCNHEFCNDCINKWFKYNNTCPVCRNIEPDIKIIIHSQIDGDLDDNLNLNRCDIFCLNLPCFCFIGMQLLVVITIITGLYSVEPVLIFIGIVIMASLIPIYIQLGLSYCQNNN